MTKLEGSRRRNFFSSSSFKQGEGCCEEALQAKANKLRRIRKLEAPRATMWLKGKGKKPKKKPKKTVSILVLGPKGAGKTTILLRLTGSKTQVPNWDDQTQGACRNSNTSYDLTYKDCEVKLAELGGEQPSFHLPSAYYARAHAIIYVLDPTIDAHVEEAKKTLQGFMTDDFLRGKPILIFGNKMDKLTKKGEQKQLKRNFLEAFNLRSLTKDPKTKPETSLISALSLKRGSDLRPKVKSLLKKVRSNYDALMERTGLERDRNREAEFKHAAELLRNILEDEPENAEDKSPSSSLGEAREVAKIVSLLISIFINGHLLLYYERMTCTIYSAAH
jgi:small GTP-binding protein